MKTQIWKLILVNGLPTRIILGGRRGYSNKKKTSKWVSYKENIRKVRKYLRFSGGEEDIKSSWAGSWLESVISFSVLALCSVLLMLINKTSLMIIIDEY